MTEITFRVPARLVHLMEELCKQFPDMEMVSKICPDSSREAIDGWATAAFGELQQNGTLRPGYYAYIMLAANEGAIAGMPFFYSAREYIDYLKLLGVDRLPGRSTLYDALGKVGGRYPDWTFSDRPNPTEQLRRTNIVRLFQSAFGRARRAVAD